MINVVIPARIGSTRLKNKVLLKIDNKPMLHHVIDRCLKSNKVDNVFVVTDSKKVYESVLLTSAKPLMSDANCSSGTVRIASVLDQIEGDIIVNVQGDQPIVEPELIDLLIEKFIDNHFDIATPIWKINDFEDLNDESLAKVVRDFNGRALYFSRSSIPFLRDYDRDDWTKNAEYWAHYGIYVYRRQILESLDKLQVGILENTEKLEQLRFLENGLNILTVETKYRQQAVDTIEDFNKLTKLMT